MYYHVLQWAIRKVLTRPIGAVDFPTAYAYQVAAFRPYGGMDLKAALPCEIERLI